LHAKAAAGNRRPAGRGAKSHEFGDAKLDSSRQSLLESLLLVSVLAQSFAILVLGHLLAPLLDE
jgi:hypothetical protein